MSDEIALKIGRHLLEQYNKWTENPVGAAVRIPLMLPHKNDHPPWCMTVTYEMPWFIEEYWENGERKSKHWSLKQWYETTNNKT